ncbi:MAG: hypothetical protein QOE99_1312, partial [Actinomycetota bacterium]|nr:hypothetical protein [Actinomycetota bacterium]
MSSSTRCGVWPDVGLSSHQTT